ncbi:hypothetical protein [Rhizomicrobium electricum]|uniref:hypothetical protein n=1 Tax=Rhizomicrobium electricum TaxID=480070 RepID=UPI00141D98DA|nr:hypothetical protein [Rhizomicrobium electricum]NIJ46990.1 hypothetical protein [Rhizomicrobium electricum]
MENPDDDRVALDEIVGAIARYARKLRQHLLLFPVVLFVFVVLFFLFYAVSKPTYVATAVIGPPNPSPINSMLNSMTGLPKATTGLTSRLLGGGGNGGNDPFQEYQQLLQTPRLVNELAEHDGVLQVVFGGLWDTEKKVWMEPGGLSRFTAPIKRLMHRPVATHPNSIMLAQYLKSHLSIDQAGSVGQSATASFAGLGSSNYLVLSLRSDRPEKAELLLSKILFRADNIIRQEQMRDVDARIKYIESELLRVTQSEQRSALIQTMANQEDIKVMMVADKRFAYVLVSPPYASPIPVSPGSPGKALMITAAVSVIVWAGLVLLGAWWPWCGRLIAPFGRG